MDTLIAALISGGLALIGTVITVTASSRKTEHTLRTELAVMNNEVKNLRNEVEKHNNFAERVPKLETSVTTLENEVRRLEGFHMRA